MLEMQGELFYHLNAWRVRTLDFAFNAVFGQGLWSVAYKYGIQNMDGMR